MAMFDRLSGNGYAVSSRIGDNETKQLDFESWGRESIRSGTTYRALALAKIGALAKILPENGYLSTVLCNPRVFKIHVTALFAACELLRVSGQSKAPTKIFDELIQGASAAVVEWRWLFKDYPEDEDYRSRIFESTYRYSDFMLHVFLKQTTSREASFSTAAERGCAALLTELDESYAEDSNVGIAALHSCPDATEQRIVIFEVINSYANLIVNNTNINLVM